MGISKKTTREEILGSLIKERRTHIEETGHKITVVGFDIQERSLGTMARGGTLSSGTSQGRIEITAGH